MSDNETKGVTEFTNLLDLGEVGWLYKIFTPKVQLRTLVGREVVGIANHPNGDDRMIPVYDVDRTGWLDRWFAFIVPKRVGIYDLSGRAHNAETGENDIESTQVQVTCDDEGTYHIRKMGYGQMIEHFGGKRLTRGKDGALVQATVSEPIKLEAVPTA